MAAKSENSEIREALEVALNALNKKELQTEDVKLKNYLNDSAKTLSGIFYYDEKNDSEPDIVFFTDKVIKACRSLDVVKKKKFYNKKVDISSSAPGNLKFKKDYKGENILHAAIGLATECGEILEEVVRSKYESAPLDVANIKEEIGDITWYLAILLRDLDIDLFDAMATNIEKLKKRYPGEKFSTERANNRDLASERSVIEGNTIPPEFDQTSHLPKDKRVLPNGGLAPTNIWDAKQIDEYNKLSLVEQMRRLYNSGAKVNVTQKIHTHTLPINEFSKPFSYLANNKDSGSFIINLAASEHDFKRIATEFKVNLDKELKACENNNMIMVTVYDITGSSLQNEEKRFILTFDFNALSGIIKLSGILFEGGLNKNLSQRQFGELEDFCRAKKINIF